MSDVSGDISVIWPGDPIIASMACGRMRLLRSSSAPTKGSASFVRSLYGCLADALKFFVHMGGRRPSEVSSVKAAHSVFGSYSDSTNIASISTEIATTIPNQADIPVDST